MFSRFLFSLDFYVRLGVRLEKRRDFYVLQKVRREVLLLLTMQKPILCKWIWSHNSLAALLLTRVTRWVCGKNHPNCSPNPFFTKLCTKFLPAKKAAPRILGYFCKLKKTVQSKNSPRSRKFAQSGTTYQNVKNIADNHKVYQMATENTKLP
jgi:hypothetical protein